MTSISLEQFERLVRSALSQLPEEFKLRLNNVDIVVDNAASPNQLIGTGIENSMELLGLYEGIPLTERYGYDLVLPDKITRQKMNKRPRVFFLETPGFCWFVSPLRSISCSESIGNIILRLSYTSIARTTPNSG